MDLPVILERIEERLRALGLSADKASRAAGKPDAIRNMQRAVKEGRTGVNTTTVAALATVLEVSPLELLGENGAHRDAYDTVLEDLRAKREELDHTIRTLEAEKLTRRKKTGKST